MNDTRLLFLRHTIVPGSGEGMPKGTYTRKWAEDHRLSVDITCIKCGTIGSLDDHKIDWDGLVDPSVKCPMKDCGFHAYIQLAYWES